jgi:hypothetical protein
MSRGLCAYAITRDHVLDLEGLPDPEVRLITHRGLGLVVADAELAQFAELDTDPVMAEPAPDDPLVVLAHRHDAVVRAVFHRQPVLPLRFGTVLRDTRAAARLLADRHEVALRGLDRVAGHREWGVRARLAQPARPDDDAGPTGLSGTEYLARRRARLAAAEHGRRRGSEHTATLHAALARLATDTVPRARRSPALLLDAAYLVATGAEPAFHAEVERQKDTGGAELTVTGPWPPYSFARLALSDDRTEVTAHA